LKRKEKKGKQRTSFSALFLSHDFRCGCRSRVSRRRSAGVCPSAAQTPASCLHDASSFTPAPLIRDEEHDLIEMASFISVRALHMIDSDGRREQRWSSDRRLWTNHLSYAR
jgi:hypothetical protein